MIDRIEAALINDAPDGLDNMAFSRTSPSTFALTFWWSSDAAMRANLELKSTKTPRFDDLMLSCTVRVATDVTFTRVGVGVTSKL